MKCKLIFAALLPLVCIAAPAADAPQLKARTWTAKNGNAVEAALVKHESYSVTLKLTDGKITRISPSDLSKEDQAYLAQVKEFLKYAGAEHSTDILKCQNLTFRCSSEGNLFIDAPGYHPSAGSGPITAYIRDPQEFIDTLDKGLEWCRIAKQNNAEADDRELFSSLRQQLECLEGMLINFRSKDKSTGLRGSTITPELCVYLYEEKFPYTLSASAILSETALKTIVAALKKVPFSLLKEHAESKKKKEADLFK